MNYICTRNKRYDIQNLMLNKSRKQPFRSVNVHFNRWECVAHGYRLKKCHDSLNNS